MTDILSPLCLVLALLMVVAGFGLCAVEAPSATMELHTARVAGDEEAAVQLEAQLENQRWQRRMLIGSLFGGSAVMFATGYFMMGYRKPRS